jgi:hypothetical protein
MAAERSEGVGNLRELASQEGAGPEPVSRAC